MSYHFILKGHDAVPCSMMEWARWMEENRDGREVDNDVVNGSRISTVFLGLNHNLGDGPPEIFETMVFDGPLYGEMNRYSTWDEAAAGHASMVEKVRTAG